MEGSATNTKLTIGLTGISFKPFWGFTQAEYCRRKAQMKKLAAGALRAALVATPATFEDALGALAAARVMNTTDLAVLDVATFPEGKAALSFFDALKRPLVLWSRDESVHGAHIGHNSFCGANFLSGNLALRGTRFRAMHGELNNPQVVARLRTAAQLIGAAKASAGAVIGLFGEGIVPKFHDIDVSEKDRAELVHRYGITFKNIPIKHLLERAVWYDEAFMARAAQSLARRFSRVEVPGAALVKQARLLQAIRDFTRQGAFAAIAIRCWPELPRRYGAWPCPAISVLNDLGVPAACEGDPGGALDMLLASKLAQTPSTLLDIVDWDDRKDTLAIWHCGPTGSSWADRGTRLRPHNVDGRTDQGRPELGLPGIVDMDFTPGKVTIFRTLGALDDEFAIEGQIVRAPQRHICGSFGTVARATAYGRCVRMTDLRATIFTRALPHHYTAARGHLFA
ncbi:MAG: hypothetical protein HYV36_03615 [Lentisphaerae bacterium]|nr:hypothetical protein [Lentisphaerota bacterium]